MNFYGISFLYILVNAFKIVVKKNTFCWHQLVSNIGKMQISSGSILSKRKNEVYFSITDYY